MAHARHDTDASVFHVADVDVRIQLIDGTNYTPWPTETAPVGMRYRDLPAITMTTLTATSFVCAKTSAWVEPTRNAPRDLYDLWALDQHGYINADAARLFAKHGFTGNYPSRWLLPAKPPTEDAWQAALNHQCIPQVTAAQAHRTVTAAWLQAATKAYPEQRQHEFQ